MLKLDLISDIRYKREFNVNDEDSVGFITPKKEYTKEYFDVDYNDYSISPFLSSRMFVSRRTMVKSNMTMRQIYYSG